MIWRMALLWSALANASPPLGLEQVFLRKMTRASSVRAIEEFEDTFEKIRIARLACRMQIAARRVPVSCFEALRLENRWDLHTRDQSAKLERDLNERCRKATAQLRLPASDAELSDLSKRCLEAVQEAREIQAYRARDSDAWSGN